MDAFELWCWRRLLRVPWTARKSIQSMLKEIIPKYLLEGSCWSWNSNTLPPDGKDPDAGKDWGRQEKGATEYEMVGWHRQLDGHEFEQGLGVGDGQGSLVCFSPWGRRESDTTEQLHWTELRISTYLTF